MELFLQSYRTLRDGQGESVGATDPAKKECLFHGRKVEGRPACCACLLPACCLPALSYKLYAHLQWHCCVLNETLETLETVCETY